MLLLEFIEKTLENWAFLSKLINMILLAVTLLGGILSLNNICLFEISLKCVFFIPIMIYFKKKKIHQAVFKDSSVHAFEGLKVKI